tara:strand:+ start:2492 stop:3487 length:996 start_codon:yes stop_codon:yes gene_type:complete
MNQILNFPFIVILLFNCNFFSCFACDVDLIDTLDQNNLIVEDTTKIKKKKQKEPKLKDVHRLLLRQDSIISLMNRKISDLEEIIVNNTPGQDSDYMLREDHDATLKELDNLNSDYDRLESEMNNMKAEKADLFQKHQSAENRKEGFYTLLEEKRQENRNLKQEIENSRKLYERVGEELVKNKELTDLSFKKMNELGTQLRVNTSNFNQYKEIQDFLYKSNKYFKNSYNESSVNIIENKINSYVKFEKQYPALIKKLYELKGLIEEYKYEMCWAQNEIKKIINADLLDKDKRNEIEQEVLANIDNEKFGFLYSACEDAAYNLKETLKVNCQE